MLLFLKIKNTDMEKFRVLEDDATADIAYFAYGKSLEEMYENAALGLFSLIAELQKVDERQVDLITVEAEDREALMLDFLNELIYRWDTEGVLFSSFSCELDETSEGLKLVAECKGEVFDEERHEINAEVKAVTYFGMEVKKENDTWKTKVTPDV